MKNVKTNWNETVTKGECFKAGVVVFIFGCIMSIASLYSEEIYNWVSDKIGKIKMKFKKEK